MSKRGKQINYLRMLKIFFPKYKISKFPGPGGACPRNPQILPPLAVVYFELFSFETHCKLSLGCQSKKSPKNGISKFWPREKWGEGNMPREKWGESNYINLRKSHSSDFFLLLKPHGNACYAGLTLQGLVFQSY